MYIDTKILNNILANRIHQKKKIDVIMNRPWALFQGFKANSILKSQSM